MPTARTCPIPAAGRAFLVLVVSAAAARGAIYNVGVGAGCETSSLLTAISMAAGTLAADEIRISGGISHIISSNLVFTDWNAASKGVLTISGGWTDCNDAVPQDDLNAGVNFNSQPYSVVVEATAGSIGSFLTFRRFVIDQSTLRGLRVEDGGTVNLQRAFVAMNEGGGVSVASGGFLTVDANSSIQLNPPFGLSGSLEGGGIYCTGADSEIFLDGTVTLNEATSGGGIHLENGCHLELQNDAVVEHNVAAVGGGIAALSGATVAGAPGAWIWANEATSSGGGILADGVTTQLTFAGLQVTENQAGFAGAGLYVGASSQVTLDGGGSCEGGLVVCPSNVWFNQLTGTGQDGAAAYVANNAKLRLYQTSVGRNAVPDPLPDGSILHVAGAGAELFTESVEVWNNTGAGSVFEAEAGGALRIAFTTAALNRYGTGEGVANSLGVKVAGTDSIGRINTSIFHPTGAFLASGGGSFSQVDCLITSTTAGLPGSVTIYVDDPEYVDLAGGDLRVGIHSPAVDFCDAIYYAPAHDDMLGEDRFHDVVANPNGNPGVNGAFDAGAFEFQDIFSDGFETGNTNNWDVRVPPGP